MFVPSSVSNYIYTVASLAPSLLSTIYVPNVSTILFKRCYLKAMFSFSPSVLKIRTKKCMFRNVHENWHVRFFLCLQNIYSAPSMFVASASKKLYGIALPASGFYQTPSSIFQFFARNLNWDSLPSN